MSGQRVTSSVEAKPCLANAALSVRWRTSASGRGKDLPGLFTLQGSATSVGQDASAIPPDVKCSQTTTARHHPLPRLRGRDREGARNTGRGHAIWIEHFQPSPPPPFPPTRGGGRNKAGHP